MTDRKPFYDAIRPLTGALSQSQVNGFERYLDAISGLDVSWQAYILATGWHETAAKMQPVRETLANSDQKAVNILDKSFAAGRLKWVKTPYWRFDAAGKSWLGRGDVQLTHKANYAKASKYAGVDLVAMPEKMLDPVISIKVLVGGMIDGIFTGKALKDYLPGDYKGARRIINGQESAAKVAGHAKVFEKGLREIGGNPASVVASKPKNRPSPSFSLADLFKWSKP